MNDSVYLPGNLSQYGRTICLMISINDCDLTRTYVEVDFVNKHFQFFMLSMK